MESSAAAVPVPETIRVLIVDDEPLFVEMVQAMLAAEEGIVIAATASNGEEGVRLAADLDPDVIVMDISMPVLDGIDATRKIRFRDPQACILILTGGLSTAEIDKARIAGAAAYLTKDRIASELVREIRRLGSR